MNQHQISILVTARDQASAVLNNVQQKAGGLGKALGDVAKIAGGFIVGAGLLKAGEFLGGAMDAASSLNETVSKTRAVFGEQATAIEQWASSAAKNLGQSKQQALEATSSFGNMFVQLGIGREQAARMSQQMVTLATDFASFHNADISDVLIAQQAAFRGEFDALQRFVPTINAAAVEQKALAMTAKDSAKELTLQEKALAVQAIMLEGAGDAMGDFARTQDSAANKQRIANAAMEDAQAKLGQALLPVMILAADFTASVLVPAIEALASGIKGASRAVEFVSDNFDVLGPILIGVAATIAVLMVPAVIAWTTATWALVTAQIAAAAAFIAANAPLIAIALAIGLLVAGVVLLVKHWDEIWPKIRDTVANILLAIVGLITGFKDWIIDHWQQIVLGILAVVFPPGAGLFLLITHFDTVTDAISGAVNEIVGFISGLPGSVLGIVGSMFRSAAALGAAFRDGIVSGIQGAVGFLGDLSGQLWDALRSVLNSAIDRVNEMIPNSVGRGPFKIDLPDNPIPHLARGVRNFAGGLAFVGEQGPELVVLPRGSNVLSNREAQQLTKAQTNYIFVDRLELQGDPVAGLAALGVNL